MPDTRGVLGIGFHKVSTSRTAFLVTDYAAPAVWPQSAITIFACGAPDSAP